MRDINDPKYWRDFDWDAYEEERSVKIKSQVSVNVARSNRLRAQNPEYKESYRKTAEKLKGREVTWGEKISNALKGHVKSEAHIANLKKAKAESDYVASEETRKKISKANTGQKHTDESKRLMSENKHLYHENLTENEKKQRGSNISQGKREAGHAKAILTPFGVFLAVADAIQYFNQVTNTTAGKDYVRYRIAKEFPGYNFITEDEYANIVKEKRDFLSLDYLKDADKKTLKNFALAEKKGFIKTPFGIFLNKYEAAKAETDKNINPTIWFQKKQKDYPNDYYVTSLECYLKFYLPKNG